ncbi:MAG TPA: hypothetical protein VJ719_12455, partial [Chthoniobacterales bacterium]|nr:hypothetical protein [Chthoniobacterales bacterium]
WVGAFGDGRGYMAVRNLSVSLGSGFHFNRTRDAGLTWNNAQQLNVSGLTQSGPMIVDQTKRNFGGTDYIVVYQLYYSGGTLKVLRIRDPDTGGAIIQDDLVIGTPGGTVSKVFPVMAVDVAGNLYVTWSNATAIFMMTSTDHGNSWSNVKRVSPTTGPEGTGTVQMPWIIAGDPGRVDIVWYRGSIAGNSASTDNRWDIYMAQTLNALDSAPSFSYTKVSETTIHFGNLCTGGTFCDVPGNVVGESGDRSFLEYPSVTIDDRGAAMITWNDNTNQSGVTAATPTAGGGPYVMFSKQICGPSLFASVGTLGQSGPVAITSPANNAVVTSSVSVQGTHSIPPGTFDRDEAGDAKFPDHGPVIGSNVPALDIRQVDMTEDATNLIVRMQVADATTTALATATGTGGGDGLLYLVQWDYDESVADPIDRVFWVAAEVRGGQALGRTGTLGVVRSALSKKYLTYNPDAINSLQVTAAISNTAPGTITLTIPKGLVGNPPNGARLYSVTGYAMSERGPLAAPPCPPPPTSCENIFNPSSLPIQVDASGAFTYVMGAGMQLDGTVELSLDDPNFSFPTNASSDPDGTWQSNFSNLSPGMHILYARQSVRGGCALSPVQSVAFTVPGAPVPVSAVSRKVHGLAGTFDIDLLPPSPAIECRLGTPGGKDYQVVVTFPAAVTVGGVMVTSSDNMATADPPIVVGSTVTVNLHNVANAQRLTVILTGVDAGTGTGNVSISAGILLGDITANGTVSNTDVSNVKGQVTAPVTSSNFRHDVTANGAISNTDVSMTKQQASTSLP